MKLRPYIAIILTLILVLSIYFIIFGFSSQTAEDSSALSGNITNTVIHLFFRNYDALDEETQAQILGQVEHIIRKLAHFTEFGALGFFLLLHFCAISQIREIPLAIRAIASTAITVLSASADEWRQTWVEGRSPQLTDVLIDSAGGLAGILFLCVIIFLLKHKKEKNLHS